MSFVNVYLYTFICIPTLGKGACLESDTGRGHCQVSVPTQRRTLQSSVGDDGNEDITSSQVCLALLQTTAELILVELSAKENKRMREWGARVITGISYQGGDDDIFRSRFLAGKCWSMSGRRGVRE